MAAFLAVPLKKTYDVDLVKPLRSFIQNTFSSAEPDDYNHALSEFNKLRNLMINKSVDKHESALEVLYRYYDQVATIESKLPITENQIRVQFKWRDAFDEGGFLAGKRTLAIASGLYEKVCMLFNIAALQTQIASVQNQDSDDGLKTCAKLFQQSSGIFAHMKDIVLSHVQQDPTPDLNPDTLGALSALMLAKAQEAIYRKATSGMLDVQRVCNIKSERVFFSIAYRYIYTPGTFLYPETYPKRIVEWIQCVVMKQAAFHGMAEFYQSNVAKANKSYGEQIARLKHAQELLNAAQTRGGQTFCFRNEQGKVQREMEEAVKDNNFIYHDKVPDMKTLPIIGKAAVAKPSPVAQRFSTNFTDLFEKLVPLAVHDAMTAFENRKAQIVNMEIGRLREATNLMNGILLQSRTFKLASVSVSRSPDQLSRQPGLSVSDKNQMILADYAESMPEAVLGSCHSSSSERNQSTSRLMPVSGYFTASFPFFPLDWLSETAFAKPVFIEKHRSKLQHSPDRSSAKQPSPNRASSKQRLARRKTSPRQHVKSGPGVPPDPASPAHSVVDSPEESLDFVDEPQGLAWIVEKLHLPMSQNPEDFRGITETPEISSASFHDTEKASTVYARLIEKLRHGFLDSASVHRSYRADQFHLHSTIVVACTTERLRRSLFDAVHSNAHHLFDRHALKGQRLGAHFLHHQTGGLWSSARTDLYINSSSWRFFLPFDISRTELRGPPADSDRQLHSLLVHQPSQDLTGSGEPSSVGVSVLPSERLPFAIDARARHIPRVRNVIADALSLTISRSPTEWQLNHRSFGNWSSHYQGPKSTYSPRGSTISSRSLSHDTRPTSMGSQCSGDFVGGAQRYAFSPRLFYPESSRNSGDQADSTAFGRALPSSQELAELEASLPAGSGGSGLQTSPPVKELRSLMQQVETIKAEREAIESSIKDASFDIVSSFMSALASDGLVNEENISVAELDRVYGPLREQVSDSIHRQENLQARIQNANTDFSNARSSNQSATAREAKLKELQAAYNINTELKGNLEEGTKLYCEVYVCA
ncbi:programmed cell death 6-interacting protein-like [Haliotis rubra]|uniref:programmed cell death 6-interacting protein-like n=1 Tax=Haliotis rubra TaxID=36100 RepID=UPI001EE6040A|nr:programmed cell death 6-interacting protein-like [Haliotis rubra]